MANLFSSRVRGEGKSIRTRARLMDAAAEAIARSGIEAASINAIAHSADVSNGTFYNHFRDKEEIALAVTLGIAREFAERIDVAMAGLEDAAARVSLGTRQFVDLAVREPSWGASLTRAVGSLPALRKQVAAFARADLERGVRDGVFHVVVDDLLVDVFMSMVATAISLRIAGEAGEDAGAAVAEHQLRMLGVPAARARRTAWREIEPLSLADPPA